jgi:UDP-N-acetyl-D-mannosaminuronic acid dehydrogenase
VKFHKICILGLGYIGLPTASTFANHGLQVVGVDINPQVVNTLQSGQVHIFEPGLRNLLQDSFQSGQLVFQEEPEPADAFIIAVPTPFFEDKHANMEAVISAAESIVPHLRSGNLVILESTSPPRTTTDLVAPILERSGLKAGEDFYLAYSPERVLPGQILRELVENARVIGGVKLVSAEAGRDLYSIFVKGEIILTDATTAEMVKLMENTYRDVNIAIANEFSRIADRFNVDIWEAIEIANRHPRVKILQPGPGVGGHCIGVDPWFLVEAAPDITPLIGAARKVNDNQPAFIVELVLRASAGMILGKKVALLGLTYKADVDDIRESPAIVVAQLLRERGAQVFCYDPYKAGLEVDSFRVANTLSDCLKDAEMIILLVGHTELRELSPRSLAGMTPARVIVDAVNAWKDKAWQDAGFQVHRLGA